MDYAYKPTTHGRAVMAACMALEKPFRVTRVAFGSGKVDEDAELADIHELLEYVSDGAVADRRHQDDRFELTLQFANSEHKDVPTFLLSEFIVYVEDPTTGGETDLLYGTLGDYRQPVPAYSPAYPPSVFNFPLTLVLSDEINVVISAPAGLATHDDINAAMRLAIQTVHETLGNVLRAEKLDLTIPATGWAADQDTEGAYPVHIDIPSGRIAEDMVPQLTIAPLSADAVATCEMCPTARTIPGGLRVYAKRAPSTAITASLTLLSDVRSDGEIAIPAIGWAADTDTGGAYPLHIDIANANVKEDLTPMLTILPASLGTARDCGLCFAVGAMDGVLRFYTKKVPAAPIRAQLALLGVAPYTGEIGGIADSLPVATANRVGGIKGSDSIVIDADGTAHATLGADSLASQAEAEAALNDVFGEQP